MADSLRFLLHFLLDPCRGAAFLGKDGKGEQKGRGHGI